MTPDELAAFIAAREPRLGRTRLVCLEGRAGAGKTTLGEAIKTAYAGSVAVVRMDDLYEGWSGLPAVGTRVRDELLPPLRAGRPASVRHWDWIAGRLGAPATVPVVDALLLDGVGSYSRAYDDSVSLVIWVEAPDDVRRHRALDRDGDVFAPHWDRWAADEAVVHARERTRDRADLVIERA